jgi:hypothetical protein
MKYLKSFLICCFIIALTVSCGSNKPKSNKEISTSDEWLYLFDGSSLDGWRGYLKESFPESGWDIDDNALHCIGNSENRGGTIIYDKKFSNFVLSFEWKISEAGNSGVFYLSQEIPDQPIHFSGLEFQILDDDNHPDAKMGKDGNRTACSLYDLIPSDPPSVNPVGEWNTATITVDNGSVTYNSNGLDVVKFEIWTDEWRAMVADSKFKDYDTFIDPSKEGYIGLQDHGNDVWFRNIKIKEL